MKKHYSSLGRFGPFALNPALRPVRGAHFPALLVLWMTYRQCILRHSSWAMRI